MKTISSDHIKEIKEQIRVINKALKRIQEAEKVQETTVNVREYEKAKNEAIDASLKCREKRDMWMKSKHLA